MITVDQYFGFYKDCEDVTEERRQNAILLLHACSALEYFAVRDGIEFPINPRTDSNVSGQTYGGFRPQSCTQGAPHSAHKEALAVDRYDPEGLIDKWCMEHLDLLETCGIYIEHPSKTGGWSHWSIKRPGSGNRVFYP